ncbi:S41 family peptidase [Streptomyces sp. NPDC005181]|uniref:S41 family peptidase n=1 Tax=Streptomyces sp. NPDC005181 TaxID=3156869 RepID=UPI0033B04829
MLATVSLAMAAGTLLVTACADTNLSPGSARGATAVANPSPEPARAMAPEARVYLTEVLDLLQQRALNRHEVDWPSGRRQAFAEAAGAATTADTYPAIQLAVAALNDSHTFFFGPQEAKEFTEAPETSDATAPALTPLGRLIGSMIGYVMLPGSLGAVSGYARAGAAAVRKLDASRPCGWIVDLRGDEGGAIWPMLDAIAPLLGDGKLGAFVDADGKREDWVLRRGRLFLGGQVLPKDLPGGKEGGGIPDYVTHNAYVLHRPHPPVAVLTGPDTASAGEATLVAFRGRAQTRSFGLPTAGLASGNASYPLSDGAELGLTESADVDRTGRRYGNSPIAPDVSVTSTAVRPATRSPSPPWYGCRSSPPAGPDRLGRSGAGPPPAWSSPPPRATRATAASTSGPLSVIPTLFPIWGDVISTLAPCGVRCDRWSGAPRRAHQPVHTGRQHR